MHTCSSPTYPRYGEQLLEPIKVRCGFLILVYVLVFHHRRCIIHITVDVLLAIGPFTVSTSSIELGFGLYLSMYEEKLFGSNEGMLVKIAEGLISFPPFLFLYEKAR